MGASKRGISGTNLREHVCILDWELWELPHDHSTEDNVFVLPVSPVGPFWMAERLAAPRHCQVDSQLGDLQCSGQSSQDIFKLTVAHQVRLWVKIGSDRNEPKQTNILFVSLLLLLCLLASKWRWALESGSGLTDGRWSRIGVYFSFEYSGYTTNN